VVPDIERATIVTDGRYALLERGVLALEGEETRSFLQGLISNDIEKVAEDRAIYAALLTPQGKCLFDFFIAAVGGQLLIEIEAERLPALAQRLTMYKLRAKVDIADVSEDYSVAALFGDAVSDRIGLGDEPGRARAEGDGVVFNDPRLSELGARAILLKASAVSTLETLGLEAGSPTDYQKRRFTLGVPEGAAELGIDKSPLLEVGFEELNGVDFDKGCFVGQELTARMKYRGLVRKRLMPLTFEGKAPSPGAVVKAGSRDIGEVRAVTDDGGFAVLRVDKLQEAIDQGEMLRIGDVGTTAIKPGWANF
jgi:folate-binding protein YgfZ